MGFCCVYAARTCNTLTLKCVCMCLCGGEPLWARLFLFIVNPHLWPKIQTLSMGLLGGRKEEEGREGGEKGKGLKGTSKVTEEDGGQGRKAGP